MSDRQISRIITTHALTARVEDGIELRTPQSLPSLWKNGDAVVVELATNERATLFAEPDAGPDVFSYKPNHHSTWHINLERLPANDQGHFGLRVRFEEQHKYLQQRDDEEGR